MTSNNIVYWQDPFSRQALLTSDQLRNCADTAKREDDRDVEGGTAMQLWYNTVTSLRMNWTSLERNSTINEQTYKTQRVVGQLPTSSKCFWAEGKIASCKMEQQDPERVPSASLRLCMHVRALLPQARMFTHNIGCFPALEHTAGQ